MSSFVTTSLIMRTPMPDLSPAEKAVLLAIADRVNDKGGGAFPSNETIALCTSTTTRTVRRAKRVLEEAQWIIRDAEGVVPSYWEIDPQSRPVCYRINILKIIEAADRAIEGFEIEKTVTKGGEEKKKTQRIKINSSSVRGRIDSLKDTGSKQKQSTDKTTTTSDGKRTKVGMDWLPSEEAMMTLLSSRPVLENAPNTYNKHLESFITKNAGDGHSYEDVNAAWLNWMMKDFVIEEAMKEVTERENAMAEQAMRESHVATGGGSYGEWTF